jgi:hypothetical protein
VEPQTPVGRIESSNKVSYKDGSSGSYESPPDPYPQPKRKQSSVPWDEITYQKKCYMSSTN